MSRDRITEDAVRSVASDIIEIAPAPDRNTLSEGLCTAMAAPSREYADVTRVAARLAGHGIGWMAFCLES